MELFFPSPDIGGLHIHDGGISKVIYAIDFDRLELNKRSSVSSTTITITTTITKLVRIDTKVRV